jgi:hypothetical protein
MTQTTTAQPDLVRALREEFRSHLETFYSQLKLAPPYESVEKAIRALTTALHGLSSAQQIQLTQDPELKWMQFRQAFETAGLAKKHDKTRLGLPPQYDHFLTLFTSTAS